MQKKQTELTIVLAIVLSFLFPGLGLFVLNTGKGIAFIFLIAGIASIILGFVGIGYVLYFFLWLAGFVITLLKAAYL